MDEKKYSIQFNKFKTIRYSRPITFEDNFLSFKLNKKKVFFGIN